MRVLVAGATGVIGSRLVPLLGAVGHQVVGMVRSADGGGALTAAGAEVVVADALDRDAVRRAVREAAPDAVVNMLTGLMSRYPIEQARLVEANGGPAIWSIIGGQEQLVTFDIHAGRIHAIYGILNPDQLSHVFQP